MGQSGTGLGRRDEVWGGERGGVGYGGLDWGEWGGIKRGKIGDGMEWNGMGGAGWAG